MPMSIKFSCITTRARVPKISQKVVLIVDNLRVHRGTLVRAWAARHRKEIMIFYLPAYSPELNPDELVNSDLKIGIGQRESAGDKKELERQICQHMDGVKATPEKVAAFFQKQSVRYAADYRYVMRRGQ